MMDYEEFRQARDEMAKAERKRRLPDVLKRKNEAWAEYQAAAKRIRNTRDKQRKELLKEQLYGYGGPARRWAKADVELMQLKQYADILEILDKEG